jgi:hypothetical protein
MNTPRPTTVTGASVLLLLVSLFDLTAPVTPNGPPAPLSYISLGLGVCGLAAVFGLWKLKSWGVLLTSILAVLALLAIVPSLLIAPMVGRVASALLGLFYALTLVLVVLPATRKAVTAARTLVAHP